MTWQTARPVIGLAAFALVLWWADSFILRGIIIGGALFVGVPIMWARGKARSRRQATQRRHNETIAAIRGEPPPAPDLTGRNQRGN